MSIGKRNGCSIFDNPITYERLFNKGTTPEQWIASRKEAGTPIQAMSPYYNGVEWTWTACEVESYLPETAQVDPHVIQHRPDRHLKWN